MLVIVSDNLQPGNPFSQLSWDRGYYDTQFYAVLDVPDVVRKTQWVYHPLEEIGGSGGNILPG
jgi:hypothetical protein